MKEELKPLFRLGSKDIVKGVVVAVLVAMLESFRQILRAKGLDLGQPELLSIVNTGMIAGVGYLIKNLATDEKGKIGGMF